MQFKEESPLPSSSESLVDQNIFTIMDNGARGRKRNNVGCIKSDTSAKNQAQISAWRIKSTIFLTAFFLMLILHINDAQKVYFTDTFIYVHSAKDMRHIDDYKLALEVYKKGLKNDFADDELLSRKANNCIKLIDEICPSELTFDEHFRSGRVKRGFSFLGTILHEITDVPSPDQWHNQQKITHDLVRLSKKEKTHIINIEHELRHDKKIITTTLEKLQLFKDETDLSNNITAQERHLLEEKFDKNIQIDNICINAISLSVQYKHEIELLSDIALDANDMLPSIELFPVKNITEIIEKNAEKDRINDPIYLGKNEIFHLYKLQSAATVYNESKKRIHSVLRIPLTDFSNALITYDLLSFKNIDHQRIHDFELYNMKKIDRILCSDSHRAVRLLATTDLTKCQKQTHAHKDEYICEDRHIWLKINSTCENLDSLPAALILPISHETFAIDHPVGKINIVCNSEESVLELSGSISTIKVPKNCSVFSKHIKIDRMASTHEKLSSELGTVEIIQTYERKVSFADLVKMKMQPNIHDSKKMIPQSNDPIDKDIDDIDDDDMNDIDSQIDEDLTYYDSDQNSGFSLTFSITGVVIGGVGLTLIIIVMIKFNRRHKSNKESMKGYVKLTDIKDKVELEVELESHSKEISTLKSKTYELENKVTSIQDDVSQYLESFERLRTCFSDIQLNEEQKKAIYDAFTNN